MIKNQNVIADAGHESDILKEKGCGTDQENTVILLVSQ
ncbi:hypothetical protein BsLM_1966 [Bacillus sp. LM 4-2]|nr:hypothetical protein BsLM_1966 [Bacillus sp. LM 4-2]BAI85546.1 hypothetical protein BSNT_08445 [Bacillus subtilis subsp. natto BEST195]